MVLRTVAAQLPPEPRLVAHETASLRSFSSSLSSVSFIAMIGQLHRHDRAQRARAAPAHQGVGPKKLRIVAAVAPTRH